MQKREKIEMIPSKIITNQGDWEGYSKIQEDFIFFETQSIRKISPSQGWGEIVSAMCHANANLTM